MFLNYTAVISYLNVECFLCSEIVKEQRLKHCFYKGWCVIVAVAFIQLIMTSFKSL